MATGRELTYRCLAMTDDDRALEDDGPSLVVSDPDEKACDGNRPAGRTVPVGEPWPPFFDSTIWISLVVILAVACTIAIFGTGGYTHRWGWP